MVEILQQTDNPSLQNQRVEYIDFLRIISTFAVVLLHIASQNLRVCDVHSFNWHIFNTSDSAVRWAVPVFVMISGALFLGREQTIEKLFRKNIFRIFTCLVFWSAFYAVMDYITKRSAANAVKQFIVGRTHLWFLFMIIGLYLIVPFLNKIVESGNLTAYFLLIFFVFAVVMRQAASIVPYFSSFFGTILKKVISNMNFHFALGYSGYFVLGYYLKTTKISKKKEAAIYLLGLLGLAGTSLGTFAVSSYKGKTDTVLYDEFGLNVLFMAVAVYVFGKMRLSKIALSNRAKNVIAKLSQYSFGVYLVHFFIIDTFRIRLNLTTLSFKPVFSVPILFLTVSLISLLISVILNRIPVLKKYIL